MRRSAAQRECSGAAPRRAAAHLQRAVAARSHTSPSSSSEAQLVSSSSPSQQQLYTVAAAEQRSCCSSSPAAAAPAPNELVRLASTASPATLAAAAAALGLSSYGLWQLLFSKGSRTYQGNVGQEYDAWTEEGLVEEYWGEHIHLGVYNEQERKAGYLKKDFKKAKYDFIDDMLRFSGAQSPKSILDVGCGIGGTSRYLAKKFKDASVRGAWRWWRGCVVVGRGARPGAAALSEWHRARHLGSKPPALCCVTSAPRPRRHHAVAQAGGARHAAGQGAGRAQRVVRGAVGACPTCAGDPHSLVAASLQQSALHDEQCVRRPLSPPGGCAGATRGFTSRWCARPRRPHAQVMDALAMTIPDNSYDLVWACESGEHMPDKKRYVEEMVRVLKPGEEEWGGRGARYGGMQGRREGPGAWALRGLHGVAKGQVRMPYMPCPATTAQPAKRLVTRGSTASCARWVGRASCVPDARAWSRRLLAPLSLQAARW